MFYAAIYARVMRSSMLEVAQLDFVRTARAKGLSCNRVAIVHVLGNALLPVVTILAGDRDGSGGKRRHRERLQLARHRFAAVRRHFFAQLPSGDRHHGAGSLVVIAANIAVDLV